MGSAARLDFDLLLITPEASVERLLRAAQCAMRVPSPARIAIQLRAPHLDVEARTRLAHELRAITRAAGAKLLVNGELELCRVSGADGVQLPERGPSITEARALLGEGALLGASRHDRAGLEAASRQGASFATLSPVLATPGKGEPLGVGRFLTTMRTATLPVFALGGVDADVATELVRAGAAGIAVIRAGLGSDDPAQSVRALLDAIDAART